MAPSGGFQSLEKSCRDGAVLVSTPLVEMALESDGLPQGEAPDKWAPLRGDTDMG